MQDGGWRNVFNAIYGVGGWCWFCFVVVVVAVVVVVFLSSSSSLLLSSFGLVEVVLWWLAERSPSLSAKGAGALSALSLSLSSVGLVVTGSWLAESSLAVTVWRLLVVCWCCC